MMGKATGELGSLFSTSIYFPQMETRTSQLLFCKGSKIGHEHETTRGNDKAEKMNFMII
jgi:hypothetical protein